MSVSTGTTFQPCLFDVSPPEPHKPGASHHPHARKLRAGKGSAWTAGTFLHRVKHTHGATLYRVDGLIRDGLAIFPDLGNWEWVEAYLMLGHVACLGLLTGKRIRTQGEAIRCGDLIVGHPGWPMVRDVPSNDAMTPESRVAFKAIHAAVGEAFGWCMGHEKPIEPLSLPSSLEDAERAFEAARRRFTMFYWFTPDRGMLVELAQTKANLATFRRLTDDELAAGK